VPEESDQFHLTFYRDTCSKYGDVSDKSAFKAWQPKKGNNIWSKKQTLNKKHFLVDDTTGSIYCWVHKAASSSWLKAYANVSISVGEVKERDVRHKLYT